ncbi:hypothetical protein BDW68DRAFT_166667 [Aspergillus falconensis]
MANRGDGLSATRHRAITAGIVIYTCYSAFVPLSLEAVGRGMGGKSSTRSWQCRDQTKQRGDCARRTGANSRLVVYRGNGGTFENLAS